MHMTWFGNTGNNAIPTSDGNITGAFRLCGKGFYTYILLSYIQIKPIIYICFAFLSRICSAWSVGWESDGVEATAEYDSTSARDSPSYTHSSKSFEYAWWMCIVVDIHGVVVNNTTPLCMYACVCVRTCVLGRLRDIDNTVFTWTARPVCLPRLDRYYCCSKRKCLQTTIACNITTKWLLWINEYFFIAFLCYHPILSRSRSTSYTQAIQITVPSVNNMLYNNLTHMYTRLALCTVNPVNKSETQ